MTISSFGDLSLHGTSQPFVVLGERNETFVEAESVHERVGSCYSASLISDRNGCYDFLDRQQGAMGLLRMRDARCASFNFGRDWLLAEMAIARASILIGILQRRADIGSPHNPWLEQYGLRSLALPCSSELLDQPLYAVYGRGVAKVDPVATLDVPFLSIVSDSSTYTPVASREHMIEMLSCVPNIVKANRSLGLLLGAAMDGIKPRAYMRITAPINVNNNIGALQSASASCTLFNINHTKTEDLTCRKLPSVIDIFTRHPQKSDAIVIPKLVEMKSSTRDRDIASDQHNGEQLSGVSPVAKLASVGVCASPLDLTGHQRTDTVLGDVADSPFSARKMFLTFVGRSKHSSYEPS